MNYLQIIRDGISPAYLHTLNGKRVVLVGPAASITGRRLGRWIESHDIIVRLNLSCPPPAAMRRDIGVRTDILYHRLLDRRLSAAIGHVHNSKEIAEWVENGVKWIVASQTPGHSRTVAFLRVLKGMIPFLPMHATVLEAIRKMSDAHSPSIGTIAICHLLATDLAVLDVTGVDFYRSAYYVGYGGFTAEQAARGTGRALWGQREALPRRAVPHPQPSQIGFLRTLHDNEPRLRFDAVALAALGIG